MELDKKYIEDNIRILGRTHDTRQVFEDFVICCAYSLANATCYNQDRENEYLRIINKYNKDEVEKIAKMFAALQLELVKENCSDVLGEIYESFGFSSKDKGQFFTPLHVCKFMARVTFSKDDIVSKINEQGYVSYSDPCCGSGRLLFSNLDLLKENDIDLDDVYFEAGDISMLCSCMTYINLSLMGASAMVKWQDALSGKLYDTFYTPALMNNTKLLDNLVRDGILVKKDSDKEGEPEYEQ